MDNPRKNLTQLFVPIALETLCYMLAGMIDTLMLSSVGDSAVGAVGTANTYIGIFIIMFNIVSSGMIAVMTQYIGANQPGIAYQARQLGLLFNAIIGIVLSGLLLFYSCVWPFQRASDSNALRKCAELYSQRGLSFCHGLGRCRSGCCHGNFTHYESCDCHMPFPFSGACKAKP